MRNALRSLLFLPIIVLAVHVGPGLAQTPMPAAPERPAFAFDTPAGWRVVRQLGTQYIISTGSGRDMHIIGIGIMTPQPDLAADAALMMDHAKASGARVTDDGPTTVCDGRPAYTWIVHGTTGGAAVDSRIVVTHVTGGDGYAIYGHLSAIGDRKDALAALTSLCPLPFAAPKISGWIADTSTAGLVALRSPDGSSFYGSFRRLAADRFPAVYSDPPGTTLISSATPPCPTGQFIRRNVTDDRHTYEIAEGYVGGYAYVFTYERAATTSADPAAEAALSSICELPAPG